MRKSLALLLDPEKADLAALPITPDVCPDYIFVGGSTGGDTTAFVRALKEYLTAKRSCNSGGLTAQRSYSIAVLQPKAVMKFPSSSSPAPQRSSHPKRTPFCTYLCFPETTQNTL